VLGLLGELFYTFFFSLLFDTLFVFMAPLLAETIPCSRSPLATEVILNPLLSYFLYYFYEVFIRTCLKYYILMKFTDDFYG